jgi:hypothetical protein
VNCDIDYAASIRGLHSRGLEVDVVLGNQRLHCRSRKSKAPLTRPLLRTKMLRYDAMSTNMSFADRRMSVLTAALTAAGLFTDCHWDIGTEWKDDIQPLIP